VPQGKDDYCRVALDLLAEGGVDALTITNLCGRLGVTTGSFYAHFAGIADFHQALLRRWEDGRISDLEQELASVTHPLARIELLKRLALSLDHEAESAIRAWARTNPVAADFQRRVDLVRETALVLAFTDAGIEKSEAVILARIGLTILVGTQQIEERVDRTRLAKVLDEYERWVNRAAVREA